MMMNDPQQTLNLWSAIFVESDALAPKPAKKKHALPTQAQLPMHFDHREGQRLAQIGTEQALYATAALPWVERAERWLTLRSEPFTSEHLVEAIGLPHEVATNANNCVGGLIRAWAQRRRIERVGYVTAR
ncbi:MAG: hypothetical protein ACXWP0_04425, partial [Ktedonobacterales bacterium]